MRTLARLSRVLLFALPLVVVGVAAAAEPAVAPAPAAPKAPCALVLDLGQPAADLMSPLDPTDMTPVAGDDSCCDPALEPGTNGNPFCFEGHSCCANGNWQCNNPDATPSCAVCGGGGCGLSGSACTSNAQCCSGKCKGNGRCR